MIEFNQIFCEDLKDDFEEAGRHERNFELDEFIQKDLSRAFAFGYCHLDWIKEKMWFPVPIRKALRHLGDNLEDFAPQLKWLNEKYDAIGKRVRIVDYANYILDNIFCDNQDDLLKIAILLGTNMRVNTADEQARSVH